jgi:hypothetical protein
MARQFRYLRGALGTELRACSCPTCAASQPATLAERNAAAAFGWDLQKVRRFVAGLREHPDVLRYLQARIRAMRDPIPEPADMRVAVENSRRTSSDDRTSVLTYLAAQSRPIATDTPVTAALGSAPEPSDMAAAIRAARGGK